jgi:hypothetical protein
MTVAELFINLGVKGDGPAQKALVGMKKGLGDISSASLAAKAGVLAVLYGLERLTQGAAQQGLELQQFANLTGLSTDRLQRWQYAARQAGVSNEEMAASFKGIQTAMGNMQLGLGAPAGFGVFARTVGFDQTKLRDTFYVMEKLKEFAKVSPPDVGNQILKSFGLGEGTIQFLRTTSVELDKIKPRNLFSEAEINQLAKVNIAWSNFWNTVKLFSGHFTAKYGADVIKDIASAFQFFVHLGSDVNKLIKDFPVLQDVAVAAGLAIAVAFAPLTALIAGVVLILGEVEKYREGKQSIFGENGKLPDKLQFGSKITNYVTGNEIGKDLSKLWDKMKGPGQWEGSSGAHAFPLPAYPDTPAIAPPVSRAATIAAKGQGTTINQTITHQGDAKDTQAVKDTHKAGVLNALRQLNAQLQVN